MGTGHRKVQDKMTEAVSNEGVSEGTPAETVETPDAFQDGWKDVFEALPQDYGKLIEEPLKEHDRKYQELQEKWNSVKEIPQEYLSDPTRVTQAMQIMERIQQDPYNVLELMAQNLGVTIGEAQQIVQEAQQEQQQGPPVFTDDDDPRLKTMWDTIQQQNQRWEQAVGGLQGLEQQREQQALEYRESQKIDKQVGDLVNAGKIPNDPNDPSVQQFYVGDLLMRARIALDQGSRDPIGDGFKQQQQMLSFEEKRRQATTPQQSYPLFMPTNGAAPANAPKPPDTTTEDGRLALMQQIARQAAG
jgi:hypothetical protein